MKIPGLITLILILSYECRCQEYYKPSGWRPDGPEFNLPDKIQTQNVKRVESPKDVLAISNAFNTGDVESIQVKSHSRNKEEDIDESELSPSSDDKESVVTEPETAREEIKEAITQTPNPTQVETQASYINPVGYTHLTQLLGAGQVYGPNLVQTNFLQTNPVAFSQPVGVSAQIVGARVGTPLVTAAGVRSSGGTVITNDATVYQSFRSNRLAAPLIPVANQLRTPLISLPQQIGTPIVSVEKQFAPQVITSAGQFGAQLIPHAGQYGAQLLPIEEEFKAVKVAELGVTNGAGQHAATKINGGTSITVEHSPPVSSFYFRNNDANEINSITDTITHVGGNHVIGQPPVVTNQLLAPVQYGLAGQLTAGLVNSQLGLGQVDVGRIENAQVGVNNFGIAKNDISLQGITESGHFANTKFTNGEIGTRYLSAGHGGVTQFSSGQIGVNQFGTDVIGNTQFYRGPNVNTQFENGFVGNVQLSNGQIENTQFNNGPIENTHFINGQVGNTELINGQRGKIQLTNGQIGITQFTNGQIGNTELINGQIANIQLTNREIGNTQFVNSNGFGAGIDKVTTNQFGVNQFETGTIGHTHFDIGQNGNTQVDTDHFGIGRQETYKGVNELNDRPGINKFGDVVNTDKVDEQQYVQHNDDYIKKNQENSNKMLEQGGQTFGNRLTNTFSSQAFGTAQFMKQFSQTNGFTKQNFDENVHNTFDTDNQKQLSNDSDENSKNDNNERNEYIDQSFDLHGEISSGRTLGGNKNIFKQNSQTVNENTNTQNIGDENEENTPSYFNQPEVSKSKIQKTDYKQYSNTENENVDDKNDEYEFKKKGIVEGEDINRDLENTSKLDINQFNKEAEEVDRPGSKLLFSYQFGKEVNDMRKLNTGVQFTNEGDLAIGRKSKTSVNQGQDQNNYNEGELNSFNNERSRNDGTSFISRNFGDLKETDQKFGNLPHDFGVNGRNNQKYNNEENDGQDQNNEQFETDDQRFRMRVKSYERTGNRKQTNTFGAKSVNNFGRTYQNEQTTVRTINIASEIPTYKKQNDCKSQSPEVENFDKTTYFHKLQSQQGGVIHKQFHNPEIPESNDHFENNLSKGIPGVNRAVIRPINRVSNRKSVMRTELDRKNQNGQVNEFEFKSNADIFPKTNTVNLLNRRTQQFNIITTKTPVLNQAVKETNTYQNRGINRNYSFKSQTMKTPQIEQEIFPNYPVRNNNKVINNKQTDNDEGVVIENAEFEKEKYQQNQSNLNKSVNNKYETENFAYKNKDMLVNNENTGKRVTFNINEFQNKPQNISSAAKFGVNQYISRNQQTTKNLSESTKGKDLESGELEFENYPKNFPTLVKINNNSKNNEKPKEGEINQMNYSKTRQRTRTNNQNNNTASRNVSVRKSQVNSSQFKNIKVIMDSQVVPYSFVKIETGVRNVPSQNLGSSKGTTGVLAVSNAFNSGDSVDKINEPFSVYGLPQQSKLQRRGSIMGKAAEQSFSNTKRVSVTSN